MFPIYKLKQLPEKTRIRKIVLIFKSIEIQIASSKVIDRAYLANTARLLPDSIINSHEYRLMEEALYKDDNELLLRTINNLRYSLQRHLNIEPAEWDMLDYENGLLDKKKRTVLPLYVYLEDIRSPYNVGAILRTAEAFAVEELYISPNTPLPTHTRAVKTARGADKIVPWQTINLEIALTRAAERNISVFALELGGTPMEEFQFPKKGMVLIGSEELGLSPNALKAADANYGRVSIPMGGAKKSLNVSVAFGILMFYWFSKTRMS